MKRLAALLVFIGGCATFPSASLVIVDVDTDVAAFQAVGLDPASRFPVHFTMLDAIKNGIAWWNGLGAKLRTPDQLLPADMAAAAKAPHLRFHWGPALLYPTAAGYYSNIFGDVSLFENVLGPTPLKFKCSFEGLAAHEAGHSLGMQHVKTPGSIMFSTAGCGLDNKGKPTPDDVAEFCRVHPGGCR